MTSLELRDEQRTAVDASFEEGCAIAGAPGTGKTTALYERVARARSLFAPCEPLVFASRSEIDRFAIELLQASGVAVRRVDDVEAEALFSTACAPLFALDWEEFAAELDPEVPGLRSPERFLESAFRLFRNLRDALVTPEDFLSRALRGATEFAAKPPNLADPALLVTTKREHHDSLDVTPAELQRQYRREIDLAKILSKLYRRYDELASSSGRLTGRDAVALAVDRLRGGSGQAAALRARHRTAFVDGAEDLTPGELALLGAIFGDGLAGVTIAAAIPQRLPQSIRVVELASNTARRSPSSWPAER